MHILKQSTAATVLLGPVLDANGAAVTSAVVIADLNITKNGTTAAMSTDTLTHSHNGHWLLSLSTSNTDTAGRLVITINNTTYSMAASRFTVLPAAVFDAFIANAGFPVLDVLGLPSGTVVSATNTTVTVSGLVAGASYINERLRVTTGTVAGTEGTIAADTYSAPNHVLTITPALGAVPTAGDKVTCG